MYLPTATYGGSTDRHKTFFLNKNLKIYGGFNGTDTQLSQRNWTTNLTILSGDLGTVGNNADNAFHVVWIENVTSPMRLDGFTIEKGNSDQSSSHPTNGGGIYNAASGSGNSSNPTIANCIISGNFASNRGGGMYNQSSAGTTNPILTNCTFISNTAGNYGGGLFNNGTSGCTSNPAITNCSFLGNKANAFSGGSVFNHGFQGISNPVFTNCVFIGNTAETDGGAAINDGGGGTFNPKYLNCSFSGNSAAGFGAMYNIGLGCQPILTNCILWGNSSGIGNPRKVDAVTGGTQIDMGAYEYQGDLDVDNDGYTYCSGVDCDDNNGGINPAATEICNGLDDDCSGSPESTLTTWTGFGDGVNWSGGENWSDGFVPLPCQDVVIPATGNVTVPAGFTAVGRTLEVAVGAVLATNPTGQVDIHN